MEWRLSYSYPPIHILLVNSVPGGRSELFAMLLLPISLLFIIYAVVTYLWRSDKIHTREAER